MPVFIGEVKTYGKEGVLCHSLAYARSITAIENMPHCSDKCVRRYFLYINMAGYPVVA